MSLCQEGWARGTLAVGIAEAQPGREHTRCLQSHYLLVPGVNRAFTQVLEASIEGGILALAGSHSHVCLCFPQLQQLGPSPLINKCLHGGYGHRQLALSLS